MLDASIARGNLPAPTRLLVTMPERLKRHWPEASGALTALLVAALFSAIDPCPDVAWQLWIGRQLLHGARFYVDIVETNPPLWFWMAIPIDWMAGLAGARASTVMVAAMGIASALSVVATGRLLGDTPAPTRAALLSYAALTLMLMPLLDLGQREHVLLIGAVPYAMLAGCRHEQRDIPLLLAVAIGIGGAAGFALKHYFLISPALIELWLLASLRRDYRPLRPETVALTAFGSIYAAAVLILTPAYLRDIVPMLRLGYGALQARHLGEMIRMTQYYWALMAALLLVRADLLLRTPRALAFAVMAVGFAAAWLIQFKGWHNHEAPVTGCLMLAIALLVAEHWRTLRSSVWVAAPTLLVMPFVYAAHVTPLRDPFEPVTRPMLVGLEQKDAVAFVSENSMYAWPLTLNRGFRYPSRQYGLLLLRGLFEPGPKDPALVRLGRRIVEETAQDYSCAQPVRIIFDQHDRGGFDMEGFFRSSPRFERLMRHYRLIGRYHSFEVYQRIAPFPAPPAGTCRRVV
ncbi:hypothetical protein [Sphingomonas sp.]|uniref:hypothetical protein n=1 Tax=Sphingomonas sp. TaxID=28214 RepID=UPI003AFF7C40